MEGINGMTSLQKNYQISEALKEETPWLLFNIPNWWEHLDWDNWSLYIVQNHPWLLLTVPRWWEYYDWSLSVFFRRPDKLLPMVPEWWGLFEWVDFMLIEPNLDYILDFSISVPLTIYYEWRFFI